MNDGLRRGVEDGDNNELVKVAVGSALLPNAPWDGPPFPRFSGVLWPWARGHEPTSEESPAEEEVVELVVEEAFEPQADATEGLDLPDGFQLVP